MRQFWSLLGFAIVLLACQTTSQPSSSTAAGDPATRLPSGPGQESASASDDKPSANPQDREPAQTRFSARAGVSFVEICRNPTAPAGMRGTVQKLKQQIAVADCEEAWAQLQKLYELDLTSLKIVDLTPLSGLSQLRVLRLGNNRIEDVSPLAQLSQLDILLLNDNRLSDIKALSALEQLRVLDLANNSRLEQIDSLRRITSLRELYLSGTAVHSVEALRDLSELKALDLGHVRLSSIKELESLTKLEWLDISENSIVDVSSLQNLKGLWYLSLAGNQVESIEPLAQLQRLREVYLQNNRITTLGPLRQLRELEGLGAHGNLFDHSAASCPHGQDVPSPLDEVCKN